MKLFSERRDTETLRTEAFLAAPQFQRSFEVLATYQRLLMESAADPTR